jgi:hypothetical protein
VQLCPSGLLTQAVRRGLRACAEAEAKGSHAAQRNDELGQIRRTTRLIIVRDRSVVDATLLRA